MADVGRYPRRNSDVVSDASVLSQNDPEVWHACLVAKGEPSRSANRSTVTVATMVDCREYAMSGVWMYPSMRRRDLVIDGKRTSRRLVSTGWDSASEAELRFAVVVGRLQVPEADTAQV